MTFRKIVLAIFIVGCQSISAQDDSPRPDINNAYITFDNFAAFLFESPRYTFGYIMPIHRRWMVGLDVGYGNDVIILSYREKSLYIGDDYQLFEVRPRVYFKLKPSSKFQPFISVEFFYINHSDHFVNDTEQLKGNRFIRLGNNTNQIGAFSYDSADYIRNKSGINLNIGVFLTWIDNFGVNFDVGLGIRNRFVNYENVQNPMRFRPDDIDSFVIPSIRYPTGTEIGANFSLNAKIFYKFNKN